MKKSGQNTRDEEERIPAAREELISDYEEMVEIPDPPATIRLRSAAEN